MLVFSPHRLRTAVVVGLAAIPAIPALPALLDVYRHGAADRAWCRSCTTRRGRWR